MISRYFIDRPIFATVISLLITLAGAVAVFMLPIAQYPPIAPPTVQVDCTYPGASAQVVAATVAAPIEQQVNGVEEMLYMASQSTNDGSYTLTVTFKPGVDTNMGLVLVQNRVALAIPQLPEVVRQTGVNTRKRSPDILMTVSLNCPDGRYDQLYLSNYAALRVRDELARLPGISEVFLFGQRDYSLRVWLDPDLLAARELNVGDVVAAIREQNMQPAIGQIGQAPAPDGQSLQIPLTIKGRLVEPEEFEQIVVRTSPDGRMLRIRDIGRAESGAKSQDISNRFDGKPTVGIAIFQLPDGNALQTADLVQAKMRELSVDFPDGMQFEIGYDTTPFVRESIREVVKTLRESVLLVALVVLLFLQRVRAAIIPLLAVPVSIVGTFAVMYVAGFSLNNLTLFGLVLAIGIVVDDAIVVVEAIEHYIEQGLEPRAAALRAMDEVSGPVIAVGLVLSSVFIPCAFVSGLVGAFFRQFAVTIAVSTILSTINSLTLSPALAALLLKGRDARRGWLARATEKALGWLFWPFNFGMRASTKGYLATVRGLLRVPILALVVYAGLLALTGWSYGQLPKGFIPSQDKGYLIASVQLPDASAALRTREAISKIERIAGETPGVRHVNSVAGNSFVLSAYGPNFGSMFIILDPFDDRRSPERHSERIAASIRERIGKEVPEAIVQIFGPPPVSGIGRAGGFRFMVEDRSDRPLAELEAHTANLVRKSSELPEIQGLFTVFKANSPQLFVDIEREQCLKQGVALGDLFGTLQGYLGSRYVNDFNRFGRTWQVIVQADASQRDEVADALRLKVRNAQGRMVPLASVSTIQHTSGPLVLTRYNMYPAAALNGSTAPGFSTGQAIAAMEALARRELPSSMKAEWTEITYLEQTSTNTGLWVFVLSVMFVFLVLAALYESWALPLAVILVVPMCVLCSLAGIAIAKSDVNIFTQIGFVVLVGLASKNAILIVEFAKLRRDQGVDRRQATLHACELRLRPILMTSFAFILGVVPLVFAHGAGAEMRSALGVAVLSGMLGVTFFGILLTPVFFYVVDAVSQWPVWARTGLSRVGRWTLDLMRLGPLIRALAALSRRRAPASAKVPLTVTRGRARTAPIDHDEPGALDSRSVAGSLPEASDAPPHARTNPKPDSGQVRPPSDRPPARRDG